MSRRTMVAFAALGAFVALRLARRQRLRSASHDPGATAQRADDATVAEAEESVMDPGVDARLDAALEETFPASDPVAIHIE